MIKVLKAGFYTTIQDVGRVGLASIGVPISGAMDAYSANLANHLLNNSLKAAVLEITLGSCKLHFLEKTTICLSGGDFSAKINQKEIALNSAISVDKNAVLSFGKINYGARCYLAVKGGFLTNKVLKSRSYYKNITQQGCLKKEDILPFPILKNELKPSNTSVKVNKNHFESLEIECYKGPEYHLLTLLQKEQLNTLFFTISNDNNRMGYRLNEIVKNMLPSILTSSVLPGTVQLTPSGKIIILMCDCQVTGGYPRVLQLTKYAISKLSQKIAGNKFQFKLEGF